MMDSVAGVTIPAGVPDPAQPQHLAKGCRQVALLCVALLCAVTIGAGTAVAQLLPPRLALWRIPRVTGRVFAAPGPVLRAASSAAPGSDGAVLGHGATPGGLSAAVSPLLSSLALGRRVGLDV